MSIFKEVVEERVEDPTGRLIRLIKYTDSEARELMKPCVQKPTHLWYQNKKMLLEKRYGDPHRIYSSYKNEIQNWPPLKYGIQSHTKNSLLSSTNPTVLEQQQSGIFGDT